jgi:D-alanyl-D-alanine carboxypeptidase (penicillin-binding protein 5/6)
MVTALEVVDRAGLDETVTVSAAAGSVGGGGLDLSPGDRMSVHDLLYALLLSSSNEAAAALAEHVGGTQGAFVTDMNRRARALGARDTHFVNPHGLDATGHYSTAADLARIGAAVLAQPLLAEIVATPSAEIQTPRGPEVEENRNLLLDSYPGAIGIKTGRTLGAGNVLVAAARRGDRTIIAVAMHAADAIADDRVLLDYGFVRARRLDRPHSTTVLGARTSIGALIFDPSGAVEVVAGAPVTVDLPSDAGALDYLFQPSDVSPPFTPGQRIGTVTISSDGEQVAEVDAVVADAVADPSGSFGANVLGAVIEAVATVVAAVT